MTTHSFLGFPVEGFGVSPGLGPPRTVLLPPGCWCHEEWASCSKAVLPPAEQTPPCGYGGHVVPLWATTRRPLPRVNGFAM